MDDCPRNEEWIVKGVSIWRQSGPEAAPVIATDRPRLDAETAARVVAYLERGEAITRPTEPRQLGCGRPRPDSRRLRNGSPWVLSVRNT